jgi:ATP adenylyltransferase
MFRAMSDPMWAPWRMEYILGPKKGECVFCAYAARGARREDGVLVAQPHAFVVLNKYPFAAGHLLVVPRKHVSDLSELGPEEYPATMALLRDTVAAVKAALKPDAQNVGFNLGKAAGAGIAEHLHGHIVPRWSGDTNFMSVIADVRVMPEYLDATWAKLRPFFERVPGEKAPLPAGAGA